jgi:ArsR family transcriptional regulator, lead/cadmium/zinc/bismuth-responsive transcriptional repressor
MDICTENVVHVEAVSVCREALTGTPTEALAETFKILGEHTRVRILLALSTRELCVCDLAELFGLSVSAVSHQLRLLRAHRLVRPRRQGKLVFYSLDDDHVRTLFREGLNHVLEQG